uniref:N-acetyltransferase domain-containing protein n=1 Tax=Psorophora albipes TaxID=869069 RepID=T1E2B1_9DIPT
MGSWRRPVEIEHPRVWITFKARDLDSERLVNYRIQDLPLDRVQDAIGHMKRYFLHDEPMCSSVGLFQDSVGKQEYDEMWQAVAEQRVAVVCFREGCDDIVGLNMLTVVSKDSLEQHKFQSTALQTVYDACVALTTQAKMFERYGVDHYLAAWGLSVAPEYRGRGVATELLRARIPLCRAMGLRVSTTTFSHPGSQIPAAKVGFFDEIVVTYRQLEEQGYPFPGLEDKVCKLMTLVVD